MNIRFSTIHYTGVTHVDDVIVAISPIDSFTGRIVRIASNDVELHDSNGKPLLKRAIQNLSGRLIFVRSSRIVDGGEIEEIEAEKSAYQIKINAEKAGYFSPPVKSFLPPDPDDPDARDKRKMVIFLHRLPSTQVPDDATVVMGVVNKQGKPVPGTRISAVLPEGILPPGSEVPSPFETQSDDRGAFTLAIRLPVDAKNSEEQINFNFFYDGNERDINIPINKKEDEKLIRIIKDAKHHSFMEPIELTNNKIPELKVFG